jgi:phospholipase/carboxylesterase
VKAAAAAIRRGLARLVLVGLGVAGLALAAASGADAQDVLRDEASGLEYLEIVTGGATAGESLPVVVAIHGLGDNPASFRLLLDDLPVRARVVFPRGPMPHGSDGFSWFEFRADDEDGAAELGAGIRVAADRVAKLIVAVTAKTSAPSRAVVCGFSQGGMLSFALAASHPELVSTAVPLAGYLPTTLWPRERPKSKPLPKLVALHGEKDPLIPADSARWSVEALRGNGYDATLTTYPGVGHALSPPMRSALETTVVAAVAELTQAGTVLPGPPPPPAAPVEAPPAR